MAPSCSTLDAVRAPLLVAANEEFMTLPEESGFVKRGFAMLAAMVVLVAVVLGIILYKPSQTPPSPGADLPARESAPGWTIRYNAAGTLARRGSDQVPWRVLREMIDEKQQFRNFLIELNNDKKFVHEFEARSTVINGLLAIADWHRVQAKKEQKPAVNGDLADVYAQVDKLAESQIVGLREQAEKAKKTFFR